MAEQTSAIIIAAGMGSRLMPLTSDKPKCMLKFGGMTLLERQIKAYRSCGITNISIVRGYQKNKINYDDLHFFENVGVYWSLEVCCVFWIFTPPDSLCAIW